MRLFIASAYLLALVLHAEWTVLTVLLAVALTAIAAVPALRRTVRLRAAVPLPADIPPGAAVTR
ncbi:hypothetical protein AB0J80_21435 [Actinoplanes sp. NPDC049548]|uniref:hypothetical protein n=1 Tax=Actinoplanes sp. NPDC049548 TaxID=3155152 RepID=UPI0034375C06